MPTGYQPSEPSALNSGLHDQGRFGPSALAAQTSPLKMPNPMSSYGSGCGGGFKEENGLWPGEGRSNAARSASPPPPARVSSIDLGLKSDDGLWFGDRRPASPPPMNLKSLGLLGAEGGAFSSQRSDGAGNARSSFDDCSRPPRPHASFAPGPPERINSFRTDVDNSPSHLTCDRLAAHDRHGSFGSEMSSASASRRPYPPIPGLPGGLVNKSSLEYDNVPPASESGSMPLGVTCAPFKAKSSAPVRQERPCDQWNEGSVVEVYSSSAGRWFPAEVGKVEPQGAGEDVLTVSFYMDDEMKQKSIYRTDSQLAPLGTNTFSDLPPGFETRPSQSKPGQLVYLDATTGTKYASLELAWRLHFQRLKQAPGVGCETVACVGSAASRGKAPPQSDEMASLPSPMRAMKISELGQQQTADDGSGKVSLPAFGDQMGSQQAYLGYIGAHGRAPRDEELVAPTSEAYQAVNASAPKRPIKTREVNPALAAWHDDAFSEWRR